MNGGELKRIARGFRRGILEGESSAFMCRAVCLPLQGLLSAIGMELDLVECEVDCGDYDMYHTCLRLSDGRILDPTGDQFPFRMPQVYLGPLPLRYTLLRVAFSNSQT
jgi:hypothetical protein